MNAVAYHYKLTITFYEKFSINNIQIYEINADAPEAKCRISVTEYVHTPNLI